MESISSNHMSVDIQASAALDWLRFFQPEAYCEVRKDFAENIIWDELGTHFDTEAMGVDIEWGSWLIDAIHRVRNRESLRLSARSFGMQFSFRYSLCGCELSANYSPECEILTERAPEPFKPLMEERSANNIAAVLWHELYLGECLTRRHWSLGGDRFVSAYPYDCWYSSTKGFTDEEVEQIIELLESVS